MKGKIQEVEVEEVGTEEAAVEFVILIIVQVEEEDQVGHSLRHDIIIGNQVTQKISNKFTLDSSYYLKNDICMGGNEEFPKPDGNGTERGHSGNGYAKITPL